MPYEIKRTGDKSEMTAAPPFGPGFSEAQAEEAELMVITGSSFSDPGDDWCRFELFDSKGKSLGTRIIPGY